MKRLLLFAAFFLVSPALVLGAQRTSEADMFGGDSTVQSTPAPKERSKDEQGMESAPKPGTGKGEETLQIGGTFSSEADFYIQENVPFLDNTASNPNILFLYLDSKLENDSRIFARTRLFYDPTGVSGGGFSSGNLSNPYGFGNGTNENLKVSLQELRLSANIDRKIFFTIGRQKVKYGTAKFFNPTDFLNSQPFNFFLPSDERTGVDMVKMHIPSGTANLYAVGMVGNPTSGNPSGGYFRGEAGYDGIEGFLGSGEISVSGLFPKDQAGRVGADISQAVGDLDFYVEGAAGQNSAGEWKIVTSAGATWDIRYGDRSSNTVSLQAEHFQAGALAEYGVFSIYLAEPGDLKDVTFVESNLFSFIDESGLSRLDTIYHFTEQINGRLYVSGHWGKLGGVFRTPGQLAEVGTRLDVNF
jgi:hypothetical protein